ncbi:MAG: helix-turn-helix domain-containing protein [Pseudomonadota bacterium]|nr:helix-turn-helix domain-containing protein [Pseudomonadota bacterium]
MNNPFKKNIGKEREKLSWAFTFWYQNYGHIETDQEIKPYLSGDIKCTPRGSWLKKAREALFLSTNQIAEKLSMTRSGYGQIEKSESLGTVSLNTLTKAAEAMGCELVYAIRLKNRVKFSENIWNPLLKETLKTPWLKAKPEKLQARIMATLAKNRMKDPEFRRTQDWSER